MAWRFRVIAKTVTRAGVDAMVEYFDDATPSSTLHTKIFTFVPGTNKAEAIAQIKLEGRIVRDEIAQAQALADNVQLNEEAAV